MINTMISGVNVEIASIDVKSIDIPKEFKILL